MRRSWPVYLLFLSTFSLHAATHRPQDFLDSIKGGKDEGAQIYQHFCVNCHAQKPLIPLGAPRFRETSDWADRLKQDIELIFKHTEEGINNMPARGGCFECSDEQLALAMVEMLPSKDKNRIYNELKDHKKIRK